MQRPPAGRRAKRRDRPRGCVGCSAVTATNDVERGGKVLLRNLQVLRLVAATMVVVGHVEDALRRGRIGDMVPVLQDLHIPWHSGVDIFFVVSGFVMYFLTANSFGAPGVAGQFFWRRLMRIAPLYWIFTGLAVAAMALIPDQVNNNQISIGHIVASTLFVPWRGPTGELTPPLSVGWTLNFEFMFYTLFALALFLRRTYGLLLIGLSFAILIGLGLLFKGQLGAQLTFWGFPVILEFLFGIALAHLFLANVRFSLLLRLALCALGIALLVAGNVAGFDDFQGRWFFWGVPAAMIVAAFVLGRDFEDGPIVRALVLSGDASYALYLSHLFTLRGIGIVWQHIGLANSVVYLLVSVVASLVVAMVVHLYVEKPILAQLRKIKWRRQALRPAIAGVDSARGKDGAA